MDLIPNGDTADIINTVVDTAKAIAPAVAVADPKIAPAVELAIDAITLLQQAVALNQKGVVDQATLAALFVSVGQGVQANHVKWTAS